jgi:hypothetical protein
MKPAEDLSPVAPRLSRRGFVHRVALASTALSGVIPASAVVGGGGGRVRFGLIADIHPDVLPDGLERVQAFVKAMTEAKGRQWGRVYKLYILPSRSLAEGQMFNVQTRPHCPEEDR